MFVWDVIKGVRFKKLKSVLLFFFKHPVFMISTVIATFNAVRVSQKEFPNTHGFHNKANAFRHALWNIFIAKECSRFSKNNYEIILWTKEFTDWHEDFAPNEELAKTMDLHNNYIGREMFLNTTHKDYKQWIPFVKKQLQQAVLIVSIKDVVNYPTQLVYLES